MGFLADIGGGFKDFFLGSEIGFDPNQQDIFNQLLGFQPPVSQGLQDLFGSGGALDPATISMIRSVTGGVAASTGRSLGQRLAGQGTLGGGIGNQALASIEGERQRSLSEALSRAAIAGRGQKLQALGLLGNQQLGALQGATGLANIGAEFQPGFLQGIAGGIGQGLGFAFNPFGFLGGGGSPSSSNPLLLGQGFPR